MSHVLSKICFIEIDLKLIICLIFYFDILFYVVGPDEALQAGAVDEGVAIALELVDGVVAVALLLADGVVVAPLDEHADGPVGHARVAGVFGVEGVGGDGLAEDCARPVGQTVLVAHHHVEVGAGEVALPLVGGLKHLRYLCGSSEGGRGGAQLGVTVGAGLGHGAYLAVGVVAAHAVDPSVDGIDVEEVGLHGAMLAEPALRHAVLAVEAVALDAIGRSVAGGGVVADAGVDVDDVACCVDVGRGVGIPQIVVAQVFVLADELVEGVFEVEARPLGLGLRRNVEHGEGEEDEQGV